MLKIWNTSAMKLSEDDAEFQVWQINLLYLFITFLKTLNPSQLANRWKKGKGKQKKGEKW